MPSAQAKQTSVSAPEHSGLPGPFTRGTRIKDKAVVPTALGTYGVSFGVHRRGDGRWQVSQHSHCIDLIGDKDTITDPLSDWDSEAKARAELARLTGRVA